MLFRPASRIAITSALGLAFLLTACGGSDSGSAAGGGTGASTAQGKGHPTRPVNEKGEMIETEPESYDLAIPTVTYAWNPQAGDPSVSAEDGGPGFTGEGWQTRMSFPALGSDKAVKGGVFRMYEPNWPATLRLMGKDYNTSFNYRAVDLCLESLLTVHPQTLEFIPMIATHWKISDDKSTYTFRINPEARWSDGKEVTSADVVATFNLHMDERCLQPSDQIVFGKMETPVALSKYIVQVKVKEESWRNFLYMSGMAIMPAHEIAIPGDEYLKKYQNAYTAVTGPYTLGDWEMNKSISLVRRDDWWGKDNPAWTGLYNFDAYQFTVVQDLSLAFEKAKKGELDYYIVPKAKWWVEDLVPGKVEQIRRGLLQKRKFFNDAPVGTAGIALNSTRPPLDDVRMRKALGLLRNRPLMIKQLFVNEYEPLNSYWQGGTYQNPGNEMLPYDPLAAVDLLTEMGYTQIDDQGYRLKDGKRLSFNLSYASKLSEPSLTIYQEDCKKAGIEINLQLVDPATRWQNMRKREYDLTSTAWGALVFPNPETSWKGELAEKLDNNNVTAFSDARVDELLGEYDREYDVTRRQEIVREIDGIIYEQYPYVLDWYGPAQRVIYWNKFSQPEWGIWRTKDNNDMMYCWWIDPEKERLLEEAQKDPSKLLPTEPIQNRFWQYWNAHQAQ
ncbi:MAG: hypothetical protein H6831_02080 [Planctomycetes bacterium]|nr:hypothetical protein [Planctomycetota bacterium]